jgi:hypothetical protein
MNELTYAAPLRPVLASLNRKRTARPTDGLVLLAERVLETRAKVHPSLVSRRSCARSSSPNATPGSLRQTDWGAVLGVSRQHTNSALRKLACSAPIKLEGSRRISVLQEP